MCRPERKENRYCWAFFYLFFSIPNEEELQSFQLTHRNTQTAWPRRSERLAPFLSAVSFYLFIFIFLLVLVAPLQLCPFLFQHHPEQKWVGCVCSPASVAVNTKTSQSVSTALHLKWSHTTPKKKKKPSFLHEKIERCIFGARILLWNINMMLILLYQTTGFKAQHSFYFKLKHEGKSWVVWTEGRNARFFNTSGVDGSVFTTNHQIAKIHVAMVTAAARLTRYTFLTSSFPKALQQAPLLWVLLCNWSISRSCSQVFCLFGLLLCPHENNDRILGVLLKVPRNVI